jgi:hypothetical protein
MLQGSIQLPLRKQGPLKTKMAREALSLFMEQWCIMETAIGNSFQSMFVLYTLMKHIGVLRTTYYNAVTDEERTAVSETLHQSVFDDVRKYLPFCSFEEVEFELMQCSMCVLLEFMETFFAGRFQELSAQRTQDYRKMPLSSVMEGLRVLVHNFKLPKMMHTRQLTAYVRDVQAGTHRKVVLKDPEVIQQVTALMHSNPEDSSLLVLMGYDMH